MKNLILALCLTGSLISIPMLSHAQLRFNPQAGLAVSVVDKQFSRSELTGKTGFTVGFDLRFGENVFFKPGLYYIQLTNQFRLYETEEFTQLVLDEKLRRRGLRLPVHVGFDFLEEERLGIRVFAGPTGTFFFSADDPEDALNEFDYKNVVWGLSAGAGVDWGIFTMDLEYEFGLSDMVNSDFETVKNNAFFLRAGLLF